MFKEKKEKKQKRFIVKDEQGLGMGFLTIVVDAQTGVNYLVTGGASPEHVTPLLDKDGKPIIDDISQM